MVWYWRTKDFPFGAARRRNGNFVFMDKGRGVVEVTPGGQSVQEVPQGDAEHEMHHDLITTPADTVLYLAFDDTKPSRARASRARRSGSGRRTLDASRNGGDRGIT